MSRRLLALVGSVLIVAGGEKPDDAAPEPSARTDFVCNSRVGCSFIFVVTSVSIDAATLSGYPITSADGPVLTVQVPTTSRFLAPAETCTHSDPMYPWQQLVVTNADATDPLHKAFLAYVQRFTAIYRINLHVTLDGSLNVVTAQPVSCTGQ